MPKKTANRKRRRVIFIPSTSVRRIAVMLLAFPAVRKEIIISQETPLLRSLLARGIIPHVHKGINAPITLEKKTDMKLPDLGNLAKKFSGNNSSSIADINKAKKKAGRISAEF